MILLRCHVTIMGKNVERERERADRLLEEFRAKTGVADDASNNL